MDERTGLGILRTEFTNITGLDIQEWQSVDSTAQADARFRAGGDWYVVEYKAGASTDQISSGLRLLSSISNERDIPLLVVPYMGHAGRELCRSAGISWIDLSGNAEISTKSLRIRILGEANEFKRSGRPESLFAPKSARAARAMRYPTRR